MDKRIAFLTERMLSDIQQSHTVGELSKSVNLSVPHLLYLFKRETGMTLVQYLRHLRLEKARALLEDSFLQIKQISFEVGLPDQSHFVRYFKEKNGLTPSEYRRRHWEKLEAEKS
jgi:transcriptional regulator GlxA family with amidase domain